MSSAPPPSGGYEQAPSGGYDQQPTGTRPTNGLAIAALVCGLLAVPLAFFVFGALLGLVAIVLGVLGLSKAKKIANSGKGMAITGIVSGVLSLIVAALVVFVFNQAVEQLQDPAFQEQLEQELGTELPSELGG